MKTFANLAVDLICIGLAVGLAYAIGTEVYGAFGLVADALTNILRY